jgi:hypothetical protein
VSSDFQLDTPARQIAHWRFSTERVKALGKGVVLDHIGHPHIFTGDEIIGAHQPCCFLLMEVAPLPYWGLVKLR